MGIVRAADGGREVDEIVLIGQRLQLIAIGQLMVEAAAIEHMELLAVRLARQQGLAENAHRRRDAGDRRDKHMRIRLAVDREDALGLGAQRQLSADIQLVQHRRQMAVRRRHKLHKELKQRLLRR